MKKFITTWMSIVCIAVSSHAQTYIQGLRVTPFNTAANSRLLRMADRLDMSTAYNRLKSVDFEPYQKSASDLTGEFWWIDGMLVQMVTRTITPSHPAENLSNLRYAKRPEILTRQGEKPNLTLQNDYFDELKSINNFEVLIHYFKTRSYEKRFFIQDNRKRYKIFGVVYTRDHQKAHAFINTLLNRITFK